MQQVEMFSSWGVKEALGVRQVPENKKRSLGLVTTLLSMRQNKYTNVKDPHTNKETEILGQATSYNQFVIHQHKEMKVCFFL